MKKKKEIQMKRIEMQMQIKIQILNGMHPQNERKKKTWQKNNDFCGRF